MIAPSSVDSQGMVESLGSFVVVVVDVQRDFLDPNAGGQVGSWNKTFCVPGIRRLLEHTRVAGWRIVHVGTMHKDLESLPAHQRRRGLGVYCQVGSEGSEFVIGPTRGDEEQFKTWYSVFPAMGESILDGSKAIIWAGVASDCCIEQSAFDGDRRGIRSVVPIQAVSASSCEAFVASLKAISKSAGDVYDLETVMLERGLYSEPLSPDQIESSAARWYREQEARLGATDGLTLQSALDRLTE